MNFYFKEKYKFKKSAENLLIFLLKTKTILSKFCINYISFILQVMVKLKSTSETIQLEVQFFDR